MRGEGGVAVDGIGLLVNLYSRGRYTMITYALKLDIDCHLLLACQFKHYASHTLV